MINKRLFNINSQAQLGEISQRHQHAYPIFSTNMLSYFFFFLFRVPWYEFHKNK